MQTFLLHHDLFPSFFSFFFPSFFSFLSFLSSNLHLLPFKFKILILQPLTSFLFKVSRNMSYFTNAIFFLSWFFDMNRSRSGRRIRMSRSVRSWPTWSLYSPCSSYRLSKVLRLHWRSCSTPMDVPLVTCSTLKPFNVTIQKTSLDGKISFLTIIYDFLESESSEMFSYFLTVKSTMETLIQKPSKRSKPEINKN